MQNDVTGFIFGLFFTCILTVVVQCIFRKSDSNPVPDLKPLPEPRKVSDTVAKICEWLADRSAWTMREDRAKMSGGTYKKLFHHNGLMMMRKSSSQCPVKVYFYDNQLARQVEMTLTEQEVKDLEQPLIDLINYFREQEALKIAQAKSRMLSKSVPKAVVRDIEQEKKNEIKQKMKTLTFVNH